MDAVGLVGLSADARVGIIHNLKIAEHIRRDEQMIAEHDLTRGIHMPLGRCLFIEARVYR